MTREERKEELYSIYHNGCDKRVLLGEVICHCERESICSNAELCLGRAGLFQPEEAAEINLNLMGERLWKQEKVSS